VPPETRVEPNDALGHAAVELFIARAAALGSDFKPNQENFSAIASICRRLDGIPLAIEFAAAHAVMMGPPEIAG
jgi:predicted ATPase